MKLNLVEIMGSKDKTKYACATFDSLIRTEVYKRKHGRQSLIDVTPVTFFLRMYLSTALSFFSVPMNIVLLIQTI